MRSSDAQVEAFAREVGATDPVVAVGGRTQFTVGGHVDTDAREVRPGAGIVTLEPADLTVRVRAGTAVSDLDAALAEVGQTVALPSWPGATVGGVLAVGHSGIRRLGWGPVRDAVLEVTAIGADGRVVKAGGPVVKNVSGYDLCRLLVGSLGTLALLAEMVLRTRPLPQHEQWVTGECDPFELARRVHRPASVLWDGTTTWMLLDGHPDDVGANAKASGLRPCDAGPALPPHRRSARPSALRSLRAGDNGGFVAEVGVGVVHQHEPAASRHVDAPIAALHHRLKAAFDPTGRLAPGRDVLAP